MIKTLKDLDHQIRGITIGDPMLEELWKKKVNSKLAIFLRLRKGLGEGSIEPPAGTGRCFERVFRAHSEAGGIRENRVNLSRCKKTTKKTEGSRKYRFDGRVAELSRLNGGLHLYRKTAGTLAQALGKPGIVIPNLREDKTKG